MTLSPSYVFVLDVSHGNSYHALLLTIYLTIVFAFGGVIFDVQSFIWINILGYFYFNFFFLLKVEKLLG